MGCDIHLYVEKKNYDGVWELMMNEDAAYGERDYEVFAVLADVRNRYDIHCIAQPRGLPKDINPETRIQIERYADHSFSWLILSEIINFNWEYKYKMEVMVSNEDFKEWKKSEKTLPPSWCTWTNQQDAHNVTLERRLNESCTDFLEWIEDLKQVTRFYKPESIRLVFGFDN